MRGRLTQTLVAALAAALCWSCAAAQTPTPGTSRTPFAGVPDGQACPAPERPAAMPAAAPGQPPRPPRADPYEGKLKVLFIGDTLTGNQTAHEGVYRAMASMYGAGAAGNMAVFIRTDWGNVTTQEVYGAGDYARCGPRQSRGRNLEFFDVVVFYINGDTRLSESQKTELLDWIRAGHGFVGIHTATAAGYYWPEYGDMIGGYFDNHPWNVVDARVIVERPDFPGMQAFVDAPAVRDEFYQMTGMPYSREDTDVLMRLDPASVDMTNPNVHRTDADFPQAWIRQYGEGRVFYSALGHPEAAWEDPRVINMYLEAIRWAAGKTDYPVRPHPLPN